MVEHGRRGGGWGAVVLSVALLAVSIATGWAQGVVAAAGPTSFSAALATVASLAGFAALIAIARESLRRLRPAPCAVARVVLDEAMRRRGGWAVTGMLFVIAGALPLALRSEERASFQIQSFLSYSMSMVTLALTLWVVLLACESLAGEIAARQIQVALVKPIRRGVYLLGKWLGVAVVTGCVLAAFGVLVGLSTRSIARNPQEDVEQRARVDELLSARTVITPSPPADFEDRIARRFSLESKLDPARLEELGADGLREWIRLDEDRRWRSVDVDATQAYTFRGVAPTGASVDHVILQLRFRALRSDRPMRLDLRIDGVEQVLIGSVNEVQRLPVPASSVADGELTLEVTNPDDPDDEKLAIIFARADGLTVSYPDGIFATNLARALVILWLRFAVLASVALCAATFLGFPVASLATLLLALAGSAHDLGVDDADFEARQAAGAESSWTEWAFDRFEQLGEWLTRSLAVYGRHDATEEIVGGRRVGWDRLGASGLQLGGGGLVVLLLGGLLLRRRELAGAQS